MRTCTCICCEYTLMGEMVLRFSAEPHTWAIYSCVVRCVGVGFHWATQLARV
jgi:hypothetical protein